LHMFPARAGVIPRRCARRCPWSYVPRTRGGDPWRGMVTAKKAECSPHARG